MKKTVLFLVLAVLFASMFSMKATAEKELQIILDGEKTDPGSAYAFLAGRTMIPLSSGLFEKLGAAVHYEESDGKIRIEDKYSTVELTLNKTDAYIHKKYDFSGIPLYVKMDVAPYADKTEIYVPLRFVAEGLGAQVDWDGTNHSVLITSLKNQTVTPEEYPVAYTEISLQDVPAELSEWVASNRLSKGIYHKTYEGKTYVLICAGEKNTGGYTIKLDSATMASTGRVNLTAQVISPDPDMMVTQAFTWPCMIIVIEDPEISEVEGNIGEGGVCELETKLEYEVVDNEMIAGNPELSDWVQSNRGFSGIAIAHTSFDDNIYVYIGGGEQPSGGYSVDVLGVTQIKPDKAFVHAVLNRPSPDSTVIAVLTYPYAVIRFKQDTIKHIDGEIKGMDAP